MAGLTSMMNIGKEMEKKLASVGIDSSGKLMEAGAKDAFIKLKQNTRICVWYIYMSWKAPYII